MCCYVILLTVSVVRRELVKCVSRGGKGEGGGSGGGLGQGAGGKFGTEVEGKKFKEEKHKQPFQNYLRMTCIIM